MVRPITFFSRPEPPPGWRGAATLRALDQQPGFLVDVADEKVYCVAVHAAV